MIGWTYELLTCNDPKWYGHEAPYNPIFATQEEATDAGQGKLDNWTACVDMRVVQVDMAPNTVRENGVNTPLWLK